MPSSDDKKLAARAQAAAVFSSANPPPQSENLPCPRCDSTNTKFCYYNNYNLSQPRHFCKSCRRYWTQGGTLRNVPIGGGTRKNSKRSRNITNNANASTLTSSSSCSTDATNNNNNNNSFNSVVKISESDGAIGNGSFTSLLSSQGNGFLGFEDLSGFNSVWPSYQEMNNCNATAGEFGYGGVNVNGSANAAEASVGNNNNNAWQMSGVEQGSLVDGDCFAWPDLAISTTANGFK